MVVGRDGLHPGHMLRWPTAQIHRLPRRQQPAGLQQPLSQHFCASVAPSPGRSQFPDDREMRAHVLVPVGQRIAPESEDRLHGVAQHAGRQDQREEIDDMVLSHRTILVLIHDEMRIRCLQHLTDVPSLQQLPSGVADCRVVPRRCSQPQNLRIVGAAAGKGRDEPDGPAIDRAQSIGAGWHTGAVQPATQGRDPGVRVCQHEDGLVAPMTGKRVGNQLCLAAASRCGDGSAFDRTKVDINVAHERPTRIPGPSEHGSPDRKDAGPVQRWSSPRPPSTRWT